MPFHFCSDELIMIMAMIPFIGVFFRRISVWYHIKFKNKCHHPEHHHGYITKEEMDAQRESLKDYKF